jgi:hypothetical protein
VRQRWKREEQEREAAEISAHVQAFLSRPDLRSIPQAAADEMLASDNLTTYASYYQSFDWHDKELSLESVRSAVREHGTGFIKGNPNSGYMLGVIMDGQVYYVHADYDARERYLESSPDKR